MPLTDLTFLEEGAGWPPKGEKKRLDRYEQNRLLWRGEHDRVYGDWWRVLREDKAASLELVFNWHRRISTLWADLLVGEPPRFVAGGVEEQRALDRITGKAENAFVTTLYEVALDVSRYGDGLLKVRLSEDGAEVVGQPPSYWFPVVSPDDLRRARAHVLAWGFEREGKRYLRVEIHERGRIENRLYTLEGNKISSRTPLAYASAGRDEVQETGVADFLVVPVAGLRATDELFGVDDYGDLDPVVQALEVRAGQVNRILDKHSDPSMYGPPDYAGVDERPGEPAFQAGGRYFEVEEGGTPPGYVTWDGQLDAQFKEIEALLEQLYVILETSPAAFGQLKTGLAESGSALKRLMQAPLAKVARMAMRFEPAAKRAIRLAAELERANGRETPEIRDVAIQWQDGLPPDPKEQAETEAVRIGSGTTSRASAIRRLDGTQEEAEAELRRAEAEAEVNRAPVRSAG